MSSSIHVPLLAQKAKSILWDGLECRPALPDRAVCPALNQLCLGDESAWFRRVGEWWKDVSFVRRLSPNCEFPTPSLDDIFSQAILASAQQLKRVLDLGEETPEERLIHERLLEEVKKSLESGRTRPKLIRDSLLLQLEAALRDGSPETQLENAALLGRVNAVLSGEVPGTPTTRSRLHAQLKNALKRNPLKTAADGAYQNLLKDPQALQKMSDLVCEATFMMCLKGGSNLSWLALKACTLAPGSLPSLEALVPASLGERIREAFAGKPLHTISQLGKVYGYWVRKTNWPFLVISDLSSKLKSAEYYAPMEEAKEQTDTTPLSEVAELADQSPTPDETLMNAEMEADALACAETLRPEQRKVWKLHHLQQLTHSEIAQEMESLFGHPFTTQQIANHLFEANTKFRQRMRRQLGDGTTT